MGAHSGEKIGPREGGVYNFAEKRNSPITYDEVFELWNSLRSKDVRHLLGRNGLTRPKLGLAGSSVKGWNIIYLRAGHSGPTI